MRLLLESDVIAREGYLWRLDAEKMASMVLPRSYEELVAARLRVMEPTERRVLEMAACVGETSWLDAIIALERSNQSFKDPDGPTLSEIAASGDHSRAAVVAAIGLSCGVGDFPPAIATTIVVLVALVLLRLPKTWIHRYVRLNTDDVRIVLQRGEPERPVLDAIEAIDDLHVQRFSVEKQHGAYVVNARVQAAQGRTVRELIAPVAHLTEVDTLQCGVAPAE